MKFSKTIIIASSIALLGGCASTDKDIPMNANGQINYPAMKILKNEQFIWDGSLSEALNVARMAQPAGVGNGMQDYADGTQANIERQSAGLRVFDSVIGLLDQGFFGLLQSETLSQGVNKAVQWRPSVVDIVDKEAISENGTISFAKTRAYIAGKIKEAISKSYPNIEWGDTLTLKRREFRPGLTQVVKGNICKEIRNFDVGNKKTLPLITNNYAEFYYEGKNLVDTYCVYNFDLYITQNIDEKSVVVVAEARAGHFLDKALATGYEGYVMVPEIYFANANYIVKNDYAFVTKSGKALLFQKPSDD